MMMLGEYYRGGVGPHHTFKGKRYDEGYLLLLLLLLSSPPSMGHPHPNHKTPSNPKPNTFTTSQYIYTQHSNNTHTIFYDISQPSAIFSINYNNPNISKFILFYSLISIYLSLLFCILYISSMTNIYHSASLYGSVCGPLASYLLVGLVRPPFNNDDGLRIPCQHHL